MIGFQSEVPLPAIVGQDRLKRALLAVAANDAIDGLLIQGEKGTAKSTAVRGLVDLLPTQLAVADCPYGCPPDDPSRQCSSCRTRADPPVEERPVPLVTVPLGATRERVVGSLSLSDALDGEASFEPGLLAQANRGVLYVDEVNLLDDHLVDVLLDAAASGVNRVERDGVSKSHPAAFTLIGTMNPEEGALRPQLRDRFALQVAVTGSEDLNDRVKIVESALARDDRDESGAPHGQSGAPHDQSVEAVRRTILNAREKLDSVTLERDRIETIADVCVDAGVDGHRGDIAAARAAKSLAALDGRDRVTEADVEEALRFALPHRLRSRPFEETTPLEDVLEDHFGDEADGEFADEGDRDRGDTEAEGPDRGDESREGGGEDAAGSGGPHGDGDGDAGDEPPEPGDAGDGASHPDSDSGPADAGSGETGSDQATAPGEGTGDPGTEAGTGDQSETGGPEEGPAENGEGGADEPNGGGEESRTARPPANPAAQSAGPGESDAPALDLDPAARSGADPAGSGRAETEPDVDAAGPKIRTEPAESPENVDVSASITEAAKRGAESPDRRDLRQSVRAGTATALVVFVVDASASMRPAMRAAKGTVLDLLKQSYQERDEVAFVAFAGEDAEVLLPPTDSVSLAARHLKDLPVGDRTPLPAGLRTASEVIDRADPAASVAVVVTDGRTNVAAGRPTEATHEAARTLGRRADEVLVVDASQPEDRAALIEEVISGAAARSIPLGDLSEESVHAVAQSARD